MGIRVEGLDHVAFAVADQQASQRWYREVLGLEREHAEAWGETPVALAAGGSGVALFAGAGTAGLRHVAFRVDRENFEAAQRHLRELGIAFEREHHIVSESLYFRDPDGVQLELTTYELA